MVSPFPYRKLICLFLLVLPVVSCASLSGTPGQGGQRNDGEENRHATLRVAGEGLSEMQNADISDTVESREIRKTVLPRIEEIYERIIRDFPDTPLAQESYVKLITIYLEEYEPPAYGKASHAYNEFSKNYPRSFLHDLIRDKLAQGQGISAP
jgi:hypothetical protein